MTTLKNFVNMARTGEYLVLAVERTGIWNSEVCQIAIIDSAGDVLLDTYVKPTKGIQDFAIEIHRITDEMVKDAPGWAVVSSKVKGVLRTTPNLIAYDARLNRHMMYSSALHIGNKVVKWKDITSWWCAMEAYAEFDGEWDEHYQMNRLHGLTKAATWESVEFTNAHSALGDCLMTLGVVKAMVKAVDDE